jgi:membrane protein implicated in regulation of membrane protease activity
MPGFAVGVLVLVLIAAVVGASLAVGAPVFAIPIVFAILVVWGGARLASRRDRPGIGEEDVRGERIEFDERDRRTLTPPEASPRVRRG